MNETVGNCPFCDSSADLFEYMAGSWKVACSVCGMTTWKSFNSRQSAANAWNARPSEDRLRSLVSKFVRRGVERVGIEKKKGQRQPKVMIHAHR